MIAVQGLIFEAEANIFQVILQRAVFDRKVKFEIKCIL